MFRTTHAQNGAAKTSKEGADPAAKLDDALYLPTLSGVNRPAWPRRNTTQAQAEPGAAAAVPSTPAPPTREQPIGRILVQAGRITTEDAKRVLKVAAKYSMRFGETGLKMGLLKREDIEFALARQFSFPYIARDDTTISHEVYAAYAPNHPVVEQLRALRVQIALRAKSTKRSNPVIAVTSAASRDGRSFTAANLAVVFAQLGHRTLLVDADMRRPRQQGLFKLDNRLGLSTMLSGRSGIESVHRIAALPGLYVLTSGPTPPNPLELLEQPRFEQLLSSADANFKAVIIDTPAGDAGADAQLVAVRAGAAIIVARANRTQDAAARRFAQSLTDSHANVLGVVFNEA